MLTIGGELLSGSHTFDVLNPATEEAVATAPECSQSQLDMAVDVATRAQASWKRDAQLRRESLARGVDILRSNLELLASLLTSEQGKPLRDSEREIRGAAGLLDQFARLPQPVEVLQGL